MKMLSPVVLVIFLFTPAMPSRPEPGGLRSIIPNFAVRGSSFYKDSLGIASSAVPVIGPSLNSTVSEFSWARAVYTKIISFRREP